jgi:hypothetical protein
MTNRSKTHPIESGDTYTVTTPARHRVTLGGFEPGPRRFGAFTIFALVSSDGRKAKCQFKVWIIEDPWRWVDSALLAVIIPESSYLLPVVIDDPEASLLGPSHEAAIAVAMDIYSEDHPEAFLDKFGVS